MPVTYDQCLAFLDQERAKLRDLIAKAHGELFQEANDMPRAFVTAGAAKIYLDLSRAFERGDWGAIIGSGLGRLAGIAGCLQLVESVLETAKDEPAKA